MNLALGLPPKLELPLMLVLRRGEYILPGAYIGGEKSVCVSYYRGVREIPGAGAGGELEVQFNPSGMGHGRGAIRKCIVMRYVKSDPASRNVYIWSDRRRSMFSGWHKMW